MSGLQGAVVAPQGATLQLLRVLELIGDLHAPDADVGRTADLSLLDDVPAALWQARPRCNRCWLLQQLSAVLGALVLSRMRYNEQSWSSAVCYRRSRFRSADSRCSARGRGTSSIELSAERTRSLPATDPDK